MAIPSSTTSNLNTCPMTTFTASSSSSSPILSGAKCVAAVPCLQSGPALPRSPSGCDATTLTPSPFPKMLNRQKYQRRAGAGTGAGTDTDTGTGTSRPEQAPQPAVTQNPRAFNQSTQYASYLQKDHASRLLERRAVFRGTLTVLANDYSSGTVQTEAGNIRIPNRRALNRAMDGQVVYVQVIDDGERVDEVCAWDIGSQAPTEASVQVKRSQLLGHVVYAEPVPPISLECFVDPSSNSKITPIFRPINRKYPQIEVVSKEVREYLQSTTYIVEIRDWMPQMTLPAGVITSTGRKMEMGSLDEICDFSMLSGGIPWTYRQDRPLDPEIAREIGAHEQKLCEDVALGRDQVFGLDEAVLLNVQAQIERLGARRDVFDAQGRRDLTGELVFTIDPDTAKDFDDACHIRLVRSSGETVCFKQLSQLPDAERDEIVRNARQYEIGVHIADVTHYVQLDSALDRAAQQTTTSVYVTDRCCPMYPFELADGLCSLNPGVPRYCFSVIYRIDVNGMLPPQTVWFGRSVILSHCRLDYVAAQDMIEGKVAADDQSLLFKERWPVARGCQRAVVLAVQHMNAISQVLRKQRFGLGSLQLENEELRWRVDQDMKVSTSLPEVASDAHHLIEEMMIAANCLVAMRLVQTFPGFSILRGHPPPKSDHTMNAILARKGYVQLDMKTGRSLVKSVSSLAGQFCSRLKFDESVWPREYQAQQMANSCFVMNNLMRAAYLIGLSADQQQFNHWGIHARLYMHFTSPIRRYADDICHRMLAAALEIEAVQAGTALTKHQLKFDESTTLYAADVLPPVSFLKLCDSENPISDRSGGFKREGGRPDFLGQVEAGKCVDLSGAKSKGILQRSVEYLISYDMSVDFRGRGDSAAAAGANAEVFGQIKQNLSEFAHMDAQALRAQVDLCNQLAISAANIEQIHHQIMLGIKLRSANSSVQTAGFVVAAKEKAGTVMLLVPSYGESFSCAGEVRIEGSKVVISGYDTGRPFNRQGGEGSGRDGAEGAGGSTAAIELEFLTPTPVVIRADPQACLGVQVILESPTVRQEE